MNIRNLSGIAIVKKMTLQNTFEKQITALVVMRRKLLMRTADEFIRKFKK